MSTTTAATDIQSFLLEGLQWSMRIITKELYRIVSSPTIRPILLWLIVRVFVVVVGCLLFHPILRYILRAPLLNYLGMKYGDMKLSPLQLKLKITNIQLHPSKSSILRSIVLGLFPSANVNQQQSLENIVDDYPESKISVSTLSVKLRVSSLAGGEPCATKHCPSNAHESIYDIAGGTTTTTNNFDGENNINSNTTNNTKEKTKKIPWELKSMIYHLIPRLILVIKLEDVTIEIEKVYLAPDPPEEFRGVSTTNNNMKLPAALGKDSSGKMLPTFYQDDLVESIKNEAMVEADRVTSLVGHWIDHVVTKMKKKGGTSFFIELVKSFIFRKPFNGNQNQMLDASFEGSNGEDILPTKDEDEDIIKAETSTTTSTITQTYDEWINGWIRSICQIVFHFLSFELQNASVVFSGAGSKVVKAARSSSGSGRKQLSPSEANVVFASLPRRHRCLTVVGADTISLSFSPDEYCNALFCFEGLHLKVGNPILLGGGDSYTTAQESSSAEADVPYAWHVLAHPFHLVAEIKGILPLVVWSQNYDHYWSRKALGVSLKTTEVAVSLSPDHLHTVLLHFDDYTDTMSSFNEWFDWLKNTHAQTLETSEDEKLAYRNNYARLKGGDTEKANITDNEKQLTLSQMKDMESRMTHFEIISLRCVAMKNVWRTTKSIQDLEDFLRSTRSTICDKGEAIGSDAAPALDAPLTPFQQRHPTPLHALVALIRENSSLLTPHVTVEFTAQTLYIDFPPSTREKSHMMPSIPSSITVTGVSFDIELMNTLSLLDDGGGESVVDGPRPWLDLSLQIYGCKWDVVDNTTTILDQELPVFRDRSPLGIVYMSEEAVSSSKQVLSLGFTIAVTPTFEPDQHLGLTFRTSNLVIVANPLPLLSAMQNLIELSDLPFQSPEEILTDPNEYEDGEYEANDATVASPLEIQANVVINVENTRILFLVDRKKVTRGTLNLHVHGINAELESGGLSGKFSFSAEPITLSAGEVAHFQSRQEGQIDCRLMPFVPVLDAVGASLKVLGKEEQTAAKGKPNASDPDTTTTLKLNIELGTQSVYVHASPSTIVALFGIVTSLDPFLEWAAGDQKSREEEVRRLEAKKKNEQEQHVKVQYSVLRKIFKEIDVDGSGQLSEDELELVVLKLFDESNFKKGEENQKIYRAKEPTASELKRERDYLLSIMDQNRTNEITFQELDDAFFRLANTIDDVNLIPAVKDPKTQIYNRSFEKYDSFLSGPMMKKLIYYEDMREYSSLREVYRITGQEGLEGSHFTAPSLWRKGEGIKTFWDLFMSETGCTRNSLNGQDMSLVQRKLVRSLCNYEFAKFCWKTLVQPELYGEGTVVTHWLLDKDSKPIIQCGVIDLLLRHVETEVIKGINKRKGNRSDILYDVSVVAGVDNAIVQFGSAHTFTKPLFEVNFTQFHTTASGLLSSQTGWFVPEKESCSTANFEDDEIKENQVDFRSSMSAFYLNTKHNHLECFIEKYNSFGTATYTVFPEAHRGDDDMGAASFSIHLNCPRFLNMNTSRSFFETASVLNKVISESDPNAFRKMILDRDVSYVRSFWYAKDQTKSGFLSRDDTIEILNLVVELHWKNEIKGLSKMQKQNFLETFCNLANEDEDEMISLDNLISALKSYTARCYFSGSEEILLKNNIGRELKASTKDHLDEQSRRYPIVSEFEYQQLLGTFLTIDDGNASAVPLPRSGKLALVTPGYKMIDDISVSPYQTMMFPLKHHRKGSQKKRRHKNASGFSPHLTVVPKSDSLDSITLDVRTSVHVCTEIPINIRIVRIGKSTGKFHKHGSKKKVDLGKKNLIAALRLVVEGSPIVYEKSGIAENDVVPLPLDVLDSSHFHALLIQPLTGRNSHGSWRDPILLTKDFLLNSTNMRDVTRCHALSGIVVQKERLNVHLSERRRNTSIASDTNRSILRRTAWDTTIQVVPFFLLSNSLPFPIAVRTWQTVEEDEGEFWDEPLLPSTSADGMNEDLSSDEDFTYATPSIKFKRSSPDEHHSSSAGNVDHYSEDTVAVGQTLRLSGVSLRETLFLQVSQHVIASENASFMWTSPMQIDLKKMKTGISKKGVTQLPKLILDLGDNCDCLIHVSIGGGTRVPECTIYSPYWIMNKTGLKMEYRVSQRKKSYLDSGIGGLPIMIHGSKSEHTNEKYNNISSKISVIPLECPCQEVAQHWWDDTSNGLLVLQRSAMVEHGRNSVDWSEYVDLDAAGTNGEIKCGSFIFNVRIESLAGAFHRSNLICFTPRYVVKNTLHIAVSVLPIFGGVHDAIKKASQLRQNLKTIDLKRKIDLAPGESTVLFNFHNYSRGIEKPYHWLAFCVNASRFGASFKCKWHLIPVDVADSHFFGEHDGNNDTMCGILEAKVHSSDAGSMLVSISHAEVPPYRIENRSSTHYLRLVQDDDQAVVFELPPLYSCAYTWDSPLGRKKLRAIVISKARSKDNQLEEALELERYEEASQLNDKGGENRNNSVHTIDSDDESIESETTKEPLLHSLKRGVRLDSQARKLNKTERYRSPRKIAVFSLDSRSYTLTKVGKQKDLPCPSAKESESNLRMKSSKLFTHIRIVAGTKILSFSDSTWLSDQVQAGILRKGGNFKSALCEINLQGFGLYIMDDFPREVMAVVVRDLQLHKPTGSIELTASVRHFQVDAMLPDARYPIIIEPMPLGVDRRAPMINDSDSGNLIVPESVGKKDCFWMQNEEKPVPVFEIACSYVPQSNMVWVPSLNIFICPLKLHIDVDYILRILGMIVNSTNKYQDGNARNLTATSQANDQLKYITRGQLNMCMTYIEKLHIAPVHFDMELNIKSDDPDDDGEGDSSLTLHSIAQTTTSAGVAGLLSWVINVGANFAHVSPTFQYSQETHSDQYCDIFDLLVEIAKSYIVQTVKQAYKVVFSMQLLGDPSLLIHQYKKGISDLFVKSGAEMTTGGKDGVGKGVTSLVQNVGGGTAFFFGKVFGGVADLADAVVTNETTSNHLKPKSASSDGKHPDNVVDGVVQGTKFLGETVVHGIAGLIGNPYRGAKTGTATGVAKGVASGVAGFAVSPFVGALGFVAKTSDGLGATTKYLDLGVIEARCRPIRMVPWGRPMCDNGLPFLKGIGIRVHTIRYQKARKRFIEKNNSHNDGDDDGHVTSKEYKRIRAAEERRKNPPRKLVSVLHKKDKYHYITAPIRPKLLDAPGNLVLSHYAVTYEETLILRSSDLQLSDVVAINVWNYRGLKSSTTRATPLGVCNIPVGDIYHSVLHFYKEQLMRKESNLLGENAGAGSLIIPVPQDYALFKPCKKQSPDHKDILDVIGEELSAIEKSEEDKFTMFDSDSSGSDSDDSTFLGGGGKKKKEEDLSSVVKANERLFGNISLSFFPIPW